MDDLIPHGYTECRCGNWVLIGVKMCEECAVKIGQEADEALIIDVEGKPVRVGGDRPRKPRRDGPRKTKSERTMEDRARDRARTRAWIRLAHIYEPMFVALYTEEQIREGIEPVPLPPMQADPFDVIARDLAEFRERQEATFEDEGSTIPDQRPA